MRTVWVPRQGTDYQVCRAQMGQWNSRSSSVLSIGDSWYMYKELVQGFQACKVGPIKLHLIVLCEHFLVEMFTLCPCSHKCYNILRPD